MFRRLRAGDYVVIHGGSHSDDIVARVYRVLPGGGFSARDSHDVRQELKPAEGPPEPSEGEAAREARAARTRERIAQGRPDWAEDDDEQS
jgi:hypothetical protein